MTEARTLLAQLETQAADASPVAAPEPAADVVAQAVEPEPPAAPQSAYTAAVLEALLLPPEQLAAQVRQHVQALVASVRWLLEHDLSDRHPDEYAELCALFGRPEPKPAPEPLTWRDRLLPWRWASTVRLQARELEHLRERLFHADDLLMRADENAARLDDLEGFVAAAFTTQEQ
jgi:hypothetical protein